jgi:hypothetical protein
MTNEVFDPASAKAIEELAKTGSKAMAAGTGLKPPFQVTSMSILSL